MFDAATSTTSLYLQRSARRATLKASLDAAGTVTVTTSTNNKVQHTHLFGTPALDVTTGSAHS